MKALVDTGCGWTVVKQAKGITVAKVLQIRCIHGDVRHYPTLMDHIQIVRR